MKYVVVLTDGAADYPIKALGDKTPYEVASTPYLDEFARKGQLYLVKTVPDDLKPGSDVANLSVLGYNPHSCYTGRSPLEAASVGVALTDDDMCFRANLVTLSPEEPYEEKTMVDYSSGEITSEEAKELITALDKSLSTDKISFFPGVSYRHIMRWRTDETSFNLTPPHDISDKVITEYLPDNPTILKIMKKSNEILINHPVNLKRIKEGKNPATSLWIWGEGKKPDLPKFKDLYGVSGSVISAVDLVKGIAKLAGLNSIDVEGATGTVHTNYKGKADAAINALYNSDFVYIHLEGPDECGHQGDLPGKISAIEQIDAKIIAPIKKALEDSGYDYKFMVMPDHPTPISIKTHARDKVPCVIYDSRKCIESKAESFSEEQAEKYGNEFIEGYKIMEEFLGN
ncbi:MAG: cofactor-independent phosphoglycerate mutase [Bacillota bacterium]|nr:cofactor-independent phosphoglycerate mutase [Bacillota bacterium]